jgi:hypothetical protein
MPVLKKQIELDNGNKIWVRQASGMAKLKIEARQGKAFRKCRHFGSDPSKWTEEQMDEFLNYCDELGCGFEDQVSAWVPACVEGDIDIDSLTTEELLMVLRVIRGEDDEGAVPLD